jgi:multisubunit Na+/H+ antiporter MnhG subunit
MHSIVLFLQKNLFYLLLAVLGLNLFQRRYQQYSEKKRFATLYLGMLVLAWMILVILMVYFHLPDVLLIPLTAAVVLAGFLLRRRVFPFRLRCVQCHQPLSSKRVLFFDSNACERCDPHEDVP